MSDDEGERLALAGDAVTDDLRGLDLLTRPVWITDAAKRRVVWANRATLALWGADAVAALPDGLGRLDAPPPGEVAHRTLLFEVGTDLRALHCSLSILPDRASHRVLVEATPVDPARRAEEALRHTPLMVTLFSAEGRTIWQNPAARAYYGARLKPFDTFLGRFADPDEGAEAWRGVREGRTYRGEQRMEGLEGTSWHKLEARQCLDPVVQEPAVLLSEWNVNEAVENEHHLRETIHRLVHAHRELEQFAYITSHDLREPLRTVVSYLTLLKRRYGDKMEGEAAEFAEFAVSGALRMDALTRDLLEYVAVGRSGRPMRAVALDRCMARALDGLDERIRETQAQISVPPLPEVIGDEDDLARLFRQLLSNAIKFRRQGAAPQVSVTVERSGASWLIAVIDNGIGFDMRFSDRIFHIFQRLDTSGGYDGTGTGLAICRKVVDRHGGRIWVESAPDKGAAFFVTLPAE